MNISVYNVMNSRDVKHLLSQLSEAFGTDLSRFSKQYHFFYSESKKRVYVFSREELELDFSKLNINRFGIYFANLQKEPRLSNEGCFIVGPAAIRNVVEVNEENAKQWFMGKDIALDARLEQKIKESANTDANPFVILKHGNDFIGSGRVAVGRIINFLPKERRTTSVF
ncbi:MAG TPA: hypothetical protein ENN46_02625 [Candidatus Woesearchaeota archaeon]|nr:hypothetical protein [Candidatus Woesearchaeota archaeon]